MRKREFRRVVMDDVYKKVERTRCGFVGRELFLA
jgi:hypothetical protein